MSSRFKFIFKLKKNEYNFGSWLVSTVWHVGSMIPKGRSIFFFVFLQDGQCDFLIKLCAVFLAYLRILKILIKFWFMASVYHMTRWFNDSRFFCRMVYVISLSNYVQSF